MKSKDYLKLIPSKIRITEKISYEVVFIDEFPGNPEQLGECRYLNKQIVIKKGQSPMESYSTFLHEVVHAFDFQFKLNLTENQVLTFEKALFKYQKLNKILDILVKNV